MLKIAFVCVHNSCRSQMAEAIANHKYGEQLIAYSAGTHLKPQINQDAVSIINKLYDLDISGTHYSKLLDDIPKVDIVITMGCNVDCPHVECSFREDWGLTDPTSMDEIVFELTAKLIDEKIQNLLHRLKQSEIKVI